MTATVVIAQRKIKCLIVRIAPIAAGAVFVPFPLAEPRSAGKGLADQKQK